MKRFLLISLIFGAILDLSAQTIDTLYYDKDAFKVGHPAFAEFYRIAISKNDGSGKYRDFRINGNKLIAEGEFIKIDPDDDTKTLFNGRNIFYDDAGNMISQMDFLAGKLYGECVEYYPSGAIKSKSFYTDGLLNGAFTTYSEDGQITAQQDFINGDFLNTYYTLNSHGYISKYNSYDDKPIYDIPNISNVEIQKIGTKTYYIYRINGVCLIANLSAEQTGVGRYFKLSLLFANYSQFPVTFNPIPETALKIQNPGAKNEKKVDLKTFTEEEFIDKAKNRQAWNEALLGFTMVASATLSGISSSKTYANSTITYNTSPYNVNTVRVHTMSYNPAIASFMASEQAYRAGIALQIYSEKFAQGLRNSTCEYLSPMTIEPCEVVSGYIFLNRKEQADKISVTLKINSIPYTLEFIPDIKKDGFSVYKIYQ